MRPKWNNKEELMDLFGIMAALKPFDNTKDWKDAAEITAKIISHKYGKKRTGQQVEGQTMIPTVDWKGKFSPATAENFAYGIITGFVTIDELNEYYFGKK